MAEPAHAAPVDPVELAQLLGRLKQFLGDELALDDPERFARLQEELSGITLQGSIDGRLSRWQDQVISEAIPAGSSVLDLGCGGGQLLTKLRKYKGVRGQGVELNQAKVAECVEAGVPVLQTDIDEGLQEFADDSFDYVVLEETLQTLHRPVQVLEEMLRVGRVGIVSFPNFGHWRVRLDLLVNGRMPTTRRLPYEWHDTPNIHLCTIADFTDWCARRGAEIAHGTVFADGRVRPYADGDNVHAAEALFFVQG